MSRRERCAVCSRVLRPADAVVRVGRLGALPVHVEPCFDAWLSQRMAAIRGAVARAFPGKLP
jgi:hypothetical protein